MTNKKTSRGPRLDTNVCAELIGNKFNLVLIAAVRARELAKAHKNAERTEQLNAPVTALLEVQEGKIGKEYLKKVR